MIGNWRRWLAVGGALGSALALFSATPVMAGPPGTGGGPTPEDILGSGSDTTQVLMQHMDGMYIVSEGCLKWNGTVNVPLDFSCIAPNPAGTILTENYEHDQVHQADFVGSGTGIKQVCQQGQLGVAYVDYARSSRGPKTGDCTGLHFVAYARDGISLESNDDGTVNSGINGMNNPDPLCTGLGFCLTQTQIQGIYKNCTITNWSQVGGRNLPIQIYTPQAGSGTRSQFETFVTTTDSTTCIIAAGQPNTHYASVDENQNTSILASDKLTFIFPFSYAIYLTEVNDAGGYRLSKIDGVAPTSATIGCLAGPPTCTIFPYSRYVYNVFCASTAALSCGDPGSTGHIATTHAVDYVGEEGWICKPGSNENAAWVGSGTPSVDANASGPHSVSPHYNANWQFLIERKIKSRGFAPLAIDVIGGGDLKSDHCRLTTT